MAYGIIRIMADSKKASDDSAWDDVMVINGYAVFMGYLLMLVKGLSVMIVTWSGAVLLGGFVGSLQPKDFLSLTLITLIQAARVFDFLLFETVYDIVNIGRGLLHAIARISLGQSDEKNIQRDEKKKKPTVSRLALSYGLSVQTLVFALLSCPLAVFYMLGPHISTGISVWRLIEHDYYDKAKQEKGDQNKRLALEVLYSLALAQGIVFGFWVLYALAPTKKIAKEVADAYGLSDNIVLKYMEKTVRACEKEPAFAKDWNLVRYAVHLMMEAKSHDDHTTGVIILGTLIKQKVRRQQVLAKQMLTESASFGHIVRKLLMTIGPMSPHSTEIKIHAARILALVGGSISLWQFPGGIQCISCLLDTFEEYKWRLEGYEQEGDPIKDCQRHWLLEEDESTGATHGYGKESDLLRSYKMLVSQGMRILQNLALDEDNCRVISNKKGLLSKIIMTPLITDQLRMDQNHNDDWCSMAKASLELMSRLLAAPGRTGTKLRREISNNREAIIRSTEIILECNECTVLLKTQAVVILLDLHVDTSSIVASGSRKTTFIWILLYISLLTDKCFGRMCGSILWEKKSSKVRKFAGEKLQDVLSLQNERNSPVVLQSVGAVIGDIGRAIVDGDNSAYRVHAAQILVDLCCHYKQDRYCEEVKKVSLDIMPKVIGQIIDCGSTREEIQAVTGTSNFQLRARSTDLEKGGTSQDNGQENTSSDQQKCLQNGDNELREALVSLCWCWWVFAEPDLVEQFKKMASESFITFLKDEISKIRLRRE